MYYSSRMRICNQQNQLLPSTSSSLYHVTPTSRTSYHCWGAMSRSTRTLWTAHSELMKLSVSPVEPYQPPCTWWSVNMSLFETLAPTSCLHCHDWQLSLQHRPCQSCYNRLWKVSLRPLHQGRWRKIHLGDYIAWSDCRFYLLSSKKEEID